MNDKGYVDFHESRSSTCQHCRGTCRLDWVRLFWVFSSTMVERIEEYRLHLAWTTCDILLRKWNQSQNRATTTRQWEVDDGRKIRVAGLHNHGNHNGEITLCVFGHERSLSRGEWIFLPFLPSLDSLTKQRSTQSSQMPHTNFTRARGSVWHLKPAFDH